ncbi:SDR family oxidoreductase [Amycolatopsis sp. EV170708-02-1]|uniref:SDR family oxidoreductase n=1 Tax=Amycolatopsis sp. EV170708-02-1 TaxID=2919322 RepID=UPI001F0BA284|nr:SDR family oxidoreductase [Amycolatopsis sp. EV170708-02-1]UMP07046.1 SDR family oxidoreductase [Amycolatopsis sp. EV170708-02-1]
MILITGASGSIGRHLVQRLRGREITAFVRDPATGAELGCPYVVGDFDDPESVAAAVRGVDRVFLNAGGAQPVEGEQPMIRQQCGLIDAAAEAGVAHIVKVSVWHARAGARLAEGAHWVIEEHLKASGLGWNILQPSGFMQNFRTGAGVFTEDGHILGAYGESRVSYVDCVDIAACAAALLTEGARPGETYVLTGPEALTHAEIAAKLSAVAGRNIRYVDLSPRAFAAKLDAAGLPARFAQDVAELFAEVAGGRLAETTTAVTDLTGRPARTFDAFLRDNAGTIRDSWSSGTGPR